MLVKIPIRLVSESNTREHWAKKSKRHKMQKLLVRAFLNQHDLGNPPYIVKLTRFAPRPFDSDNNQSCFKWIRDACSEVLLSCNIPGQADNDNRIQWHYAYEKTKDKEHFLTIDIKPVASFF
jgi:hypothetical protein